MGKVLESMDLNCFGGKVYREECLWQGGGWKRKSVEAPGGKSSVWPLRINLQTEMARLFPAMLSTRISFPSPDPHLLKHKGHGPQWATYCEQWAGLVAEVTQGDCERQTGRRSTVSSKIWDKVNQSLKSLPFKGPNDHCSFPPSTQLCLRCGVLWRWYFALSSIFHWLALISANMISSWYHD